VTGRRLLLLRHGRTAWNAIGRAQGLADVDLDEVGHAQAAAAAPYLASLGPEALWTSHLLRARRTCAYVEAATGLAATVDERLREFDVGAREGMTAVEFAAAFPAAFEAWAAGEEMVRVPGSEVAAEVTARLVPALRGCLDALTPGATGVVVTHGAALKVGLAGLLGWPLRQTVTLRGVDNCGWVELVEQGPGGPLRLEGYNQRVGVPGGDFASATRVG
jgi:glucosyl-3-phosphoglycerate phosphatase